MGVHAEWSAAGSADQHVNLRTPCFWNDVPVHLVGTRNAFPNILKCSTRYLAIFRRRLKRFYFSSVFEVTYYNK